MSWLSPRQQEAQEKQDILAIFGVTAQQVAQSPSLKQECGWHGTHDENATTGICDKCWKENFPHIKRKH